MVEYTFNNEHYYLMFNGDAFFDVRAVSGDADIFETLQSNDFTKVCQIAAILSEKGAAYRRWKNLEPCGGVLDAEVLRVSATIEDAVTLQAALVSAISRGLSREVPDNDSGDVDLTLIEFNKKKD